MPGILPMKVIKVGTSAQSRIAQACDRCRSKKIRCDGTRPTCSQCAQVGFECRTSDKLSRRAFPRGYTESLESRVRELETENRELKDLLDEKDEKIDMLSKMHGNRNTTSERRPSRCERRPSTQTTRRDHDGSADKENSFRVLASPLVLSATNSNSFLMGASSGYPFIETLKRKVSESGKPCADFVSEAFLHVQGVQPLSANPQSKMEETPPRLFADRCVNVYFQEWAPLFPILHKPTFLKTYEEFLADPEKVRKPATLAKLFMVFSIGAGEHGEPDLMAGCEERWRRLLKDMEEEETMDTVKCLSLALLYSTIRADYRKMQHWKALAVTVAMRLGLNHSQKGTRFNPLESETRKKVFWTLYTLDCFTAATLGLPKMIKDEHVQAEYPADCDDDYLSEKGFVPTLPGESTRISSALALFRASRILGQVLDVIYPCADSYELSLQQMGSLATDLEQWYTELPAHLRLTFKQGKPSTDVTGSRAPILALVYHHIRSLIYRPALGSTLGDKAASALISAADSSKHTIQIVQLLDERSMTFSFCINKGDVLSLCGMTLLYQTIDLKEDSRVLREAERLVNQVLHMLKKGGVPGTLVLWNVAKLLISVEGTSPTASSGVLALPKSGSSDSGRPCSQGNKDTSTVSSRRKSSSSKKSRLANVRTSSENDLRQQQEKLRRMTMPTLAGQRLGHMYQQQVSRHSSMDLGNGHANHTARPTNSHSHLDFFSLDETLSQDTSSARTSLEQEERRPMVPAFIEPDYHPAASGGGMSRQARGSNAWEEFLGSIESGQNNLYDAIYGGQPPNLNQWSSPGDCLEELANFTLNNDMNGIAPGFSDMDMKGYSVAPAPQSVLSISSDDSSGGESMGMSELGLDLGLGVHDVMNMKGDGGFDRGVPAPTSVMSLGSNTDEEAAGNELGGLDLGLGPDEYQRLLADCGVTS